MTPKARIDVSVISSLSHRLNNHPLYASIQTLEDLRLFMGHHIYSVWDFMSLLKYLQRCVAPVQVPWAPVSSASARYFINQIVLGEESDEGLPDSNGNQTYASHFELYCDAMREIGADPSAALRFSTFAMQQGIHAAFALGVAPAAARLFMESTFALIDSNKPHVVASAFSFGREHIIPTMFRALLDQMQITAQEAPIFHYYIERHIHLDEDFHAPLSLQMVNELIDGDATKACEAELAAHQAVEARLSFWDGVLAAIHAQKRLTPA